MEKSELPTPLQQAARKLDVARLTMEEAHEIQATETEAIAKARDALFVANLSRGVGSREAAQLAGLTGNVQNHLYRTRGLQRRCAEHNQRPNGFHEPLVDFEQAVSELPPPFEPTSLEGKSWV